MKFSHFSLKIYWIFFKFWSRIWTILKFCLQENIKFEVKIKKKKILKYQIDGLSAHLTKSHPTWFYIFLINFFTFFFFLILVDDYVILLVVLKKYNSLIFRVGAENLEEFRSREPKFFQILASLYFIDRLHFFYF